MNHPNSGKAKKIPSSGYYFWEHDMYPYLLGGRGRLLPSGLVEIASYGNATFKPVYAFKNVAKGKAFHDQLRILRRQGDEALTLLRRGLNGALDLLKNDVQEHLVGEAPK